MSDVLRCNISDMFTVASLSIIIQGISRIATAREATVIIHAFIFTAMVTRHTFVNVWQLK